MITEEIKSSMAELGVKEFQPALVVLLAEVEEAYHGILPLPTFEEIGKTLDLTIKRPDGKATSTSHVSKLLRSLNDQGIIEFVKDGQHRFFFRLTDAGWKYVYERVGRHERTAAGD